VHDESHHFGWGDVKSENRTISDGQVYSIFDTGASSILVSSFFFYDILNQIYDHVGAKEYEVRSNDGYVMTVCYDNFPNLYFMFGNLWIEVRPEDYVIDVSAA
jgi:hypothetical protein